jgi:DNA-binding NtrC family response regulator
MGKARLAREGRGRLVLIVDDEPACRFALEEVLRSEGHTVHSAGTREEAQQLVRTNAYDLALLDNRLTSSPQGHEGLDILCQIRSRTRTTRVILITGHGSPMVQAAARELGAVTYLEKPVPLDTILGVMRAFGVYSADAGPPSVVSGGPGVKPTREE